MSVAQDDWNDHHGGFAVNTNETTAADDGLAEFTAYFVKNYPGPNTVIGHPEWHAPKIFRAAQYAIRTSRRAVQERDTVREAAMELIAARDACADFIDADDPRNADKIARVQTAWTVLRSALAGTPHDATRSDT